MKSVWRVRRLVIFKITAVLYLQVWNNLNADRALFCELTDAKTLWICVAQPGVRLHFHARQTTHEWRRDACVRVYFACSFKWSSRTQTHTKRSIVRVHLCYNVFIKYHPLWRCGRLDDCFWNMLQTTALRMQRRVPGGMFKRDNKWCVFSIIWLLMLSILHSLAYAHVLRRANGVRMMFAFFIAEIQFI